MKEYIEREALQDSIDSMDWYHVGPNGLMIGAKNEDEAVYPAIDIFTAIKNAPAADVAPIIHGQWIGIEGDVCSECGASLSEIMDADSYYAIGFEPKQLVACPFCGARMDGGNPNA